MNNGILFYFNYKGESLGSGTKVILDKSFIYKSCGIDMDMVSFYRRTEVRTNGVFAFFAPLYPVNYYFLPIRKIDDKVVPYEIFIKVDDVGKAVKEVLQKRIVEKKEPDKDIIFVYTIIYLLFLFFVMIFKEFYLGWILGTIIFINKIKEEFQ